MSEQQFYSTSGTSGASPGESPYLNRITWASYKALSRGQLGGLVLGGLIGLGVGIAAAALSAVALPALPALGVSALGGTGIAAVVGGFTAVGAKYYYDVFKEVGAASGAVAAGMEIAEERSQVMNIKLDTILNVLAKDGKISPQEIKIIEDDVEAVYQKGTHNFEKKFIDKPTYFWQIGAVGALAGMALLAAIGGAGYLVSALVGHAPDLGVFFAAQNIPILGAAVAGSALAGASYGINRNLYRHVLNVTNALFEGNLGEVEKQRARQYGLEPEQELPDFTPVKSAVPAKSSATPSSKVTAAQVDNRKSQEVLAQNLGDTSSWLEIQRARAEEAARMEQQPRLH